ncbi:uncharacterized protein C8R40DRAFT_842459 [Lentinula edodes]|uniref:uncharacterized protein n=1 Tax=Lentinula edodes TaxID=5353 RepID=UPI001E8DE68D|nr:uncharacterized protein C8R40DRAFT_842459 [Lentinula edodes]KAH7868397.1 hypothetical protein C8R40DRAFT_842459 [Lentinula edodes]
MQLSANHPLRISHSSMNDHARRVCRQQHTPPLSAGHEPSSAKSSEYSPRHDNGGYLTPGMPLSAQMMPLPGSVSTGSVIRSDDHSQMQNKRSRPSSLTPIAALPRDSRPPHVAYAPQYQSYQPPMPPPSPYHQMSPIAAPPSSMPHTSLPPSPHTQMQHQPSAPPTHPAYSYQQQQQQSYMPRSNTQHIASHPPSSHPSHNYHPAPPQHPQSQAPQQIQAPPPSHSTLSQPHPHMPYPSPSPSVSQEHHWEPHHQSQPQHPQPVHPVQHHNVHHAPLPPPPTATPSSLSIQHNQYSHPPPPPPPVVHHHQQPQPQHQPQHTIYMQPMNPPSSTSSQTSLARAAPPIVTNSIAAPEVDIRTPYPMNAKPSARENTMSEIVKLCSILYDFASRYSTLSSALPHVQPSQTEVTEMARRASEVVRLLEVLRQMDGSEDSSSKNEEVPSSIPTSPDDHRPPKRPWEDMARDGQASGDDTAGIFSELPSASITSGQTTAEQDMELIRSKRATTTAGSSASSGQLKSKYRKRSRATPPGKCHSCNIRETPEWRRGPDGARTLCNACGLHYAKLMRKQAKLQNGEPPPKIDLDTLKASTKAAEAERNAKADENTAPGSTPQHHQGSFQVMSVMSPVEAQNSPTTSSDPNRLPAHHQTILPPPTGSGSMHPPPPPWAAANIPRAFTPSDQFQSQSFIRTNQVSPR